MTIKLIQSLMSNIKKQLYTKCCEAAALKVKELSSIIQETQDAANNETKSSAGDKHETGRAMAQLETEKLTKQLSEALNLEQILTQINPDIEHNKVGLGSLVITNNGSFYISVSLGKIEFNNQTYFAVSSASPIGKLFAGLSTGNELSFNNRSYKIEQIS